VHPFLDRPGPIAFRIGAIAAVTINEVEAADAGYTFSPDGGGSFPFRSQGVRVPRLEDLQAGWPEARVNIDPRPTPASYRSRRSSTG
jgi:glycerophosphoryl diester phosphodiesterase